MNPMQNVPTCTITIPTHKSTHVQKLTESQAQPYSHPQPYSGAVRQSYTDLSYHLLQTEQLTECCGEVAAREAQHIRQLPLILLEQLGTNSDVPVAPQCSVIQTAASRSTESGIAAPTTAHTVTEV